MRPRFGKIAASGAAGRCSSLEAIASRWQTEALPRRQPDRDRSAELLRGAGKLQQLGGCFQVAASAEQQDLARRQHALPRTRAGAATFVGPRCARLQRSDVAARGERR
jgi:hypothetical protein